VTILRVNTYPKRPNPMISLFQKAITRLYESAEARERASRDAYLAEATDLVDLEYRMKQIDKARSSNSYWQH
jgi:hypothetical protein